MENGCNVDVALADYQKEAVHKLRTGKILWGGVGSGKSRTSLMYYMTYEKKRDLYVITTAKKRDTLDWEREALLFGISTERELSSAGRLVVDSWNNIKKYEGVSNAFFILDEQRLVGSGAWTKSFYTIAAKNEWILLSATPGDTWLDYIPVFVANGYYKNRTDFLRQHVIYNRFTKYPKVDRFVNTGRLIHRRAEILVHMPYMSHARSSVKNIPVNYNKELYERILKDRWNPYKNEPIKSRAELFYLARRVMNSDEQRLSEVKRLLEIHKKLIVFYNFDYELDVLRSLNVLCTVAEWNGHKHEELPVTERWVYLVQYTSGAESWNCIQTNATCFYSLTYSYRSYKQALGRIDRLDTPFDELYYYNLICQAPLDRAIIAALSKKKNFNEAGFKL